MHRDCIYHAGIDTNNGIESQNKLLKHTYLSRHRNITLSSLVLKINEEFLPDRYQKYLLQNYQMSEMYMYRAYKSNIPAYLKGRPRQVIMHCLERLRKGQKIMKTTIILKLNRRVMERYIA